MKIIRGARCGLRYPTIIVDQYDPQDNIFKVYPYNEVTQKASNKRILLPAAAFGVFPEWIIHPFTMLMEHGTVSHHVMQNGVPYYVVDSPEPEYGFLLPALENVSFTKTREKFLKGLIEPRGIIPKNQTLAERQPGDDFVSVSLSNEYLEGRITSMFRRKELDSRDSYPDVEILQEIGVEELSNPEGNLFIIISTNHNQTLVTLHAEDCKPEIVQ